MNLMAGMSNNNNARLARITRRLGLAALILWPGMTTLQLALFWTSSSYRAASIAAVAAVRASGSAFAAGVPWFGLLTFVGTLCALAWVGCWAWRIVQWALRRAGRVA